MASPPNLPLTSLVINGEEYSILEAPSEGSPLVVALKDELYSELNLKDLVDYLKSVARFIQVADYATGAAPAVKEVQEIRRNICHLGRNISKLCDESSTTVAKFQSMSRTVSTELQAAYAYLKDGYESSAISCLSTLSEKAEKVAKAADKMRADFEEQAGEVEKVAIKCMECQGEKAEDRKKEQSQLEEDRKLTEKIMEEHHRDEERAKKQKMQYEEKEDAEIENFDTGFCSTVKRWILGQSGMEKAEEFRKKKIMYCEEENKSKKLFREEMSKQVAIRKRMEDCRADVIKYIKVADFLHRAVSALKGLAATMQKAVFFWEKLQEYCQNLEEEWKGKKVSDLENIWTSRSFKNQAIAYYAKWIALRAMSDQYMNEIALIKGDLLSYVVQNLDREQCQAKLRELCSDFNEDADSTQDKF